MKYMCGTYFKSLCKYSVQEYTDARNHRFCFKISDTGDSSKVFCKTEYLRHFLTNFRIDYPFDLVTHNSDINISLEDYAEASHLQPNLRRWYAQNLNCVSDNMEILPIGLANPKWDHGNQDIFKAVRDLFLSKSTLVDVNFDIYTNVSERQRCLTEIGLPMRDRTPFEDHLKSMASSFFCISPEGNGIDCHRHWEALYLKTVPIVTRSLFTESLQEKGIPLLILDDWSQFKKAELNSHLYYNITNGFDWDCLNNLFLKPS